MPLVYNGTTIENAIYNGTTLEKIIYNGTEVFSAGFNFNPTISSNTTDYNLRNAAIAAGWDGVKKLKGTVTINSGVYVYSTSTGTPAFSTGSLPAGSDVTVVNNGTILGKGGNGASCLPWKTPGTSGGTGFYATSAIKITNNGRISGGGGGGGRGSLVGTGGGGIGNGSKGYINCGNTYGSGEGSNGTLTAPGSGGDGGYYYDGGDLIYGSWGGSGGTYGSAGGSPSGGTSGGGGGAAVVGNGYITWNATGTRNGAIS